MKDILDENREVCDCPIDCQVNNTVKAQKSMKDIVKIIHLPSVVQSECYEATRILFVNKENKNYDFTQQFHVTVAPFWRESIRWTQTAYAVLCQPHHTDTLFSFKSKRKWQMDYFDNVFHTFLGLDSVIYLSVNGTVTSLPVFIQNILNWVPKTNKAFTGLERHGSKWLMTKFSFSGGVTL